MELILLALLAFVSTISGQTMVPQCRCNQLRVCVQQEEQAMQTCAMSSQCMALLGGNRNQVSSCLTQKMQRGDTMDSCMKMKVAHMTCTNSTNPMQVRSRPMTSQQPMTTTDRSAVGQYHTCVKNCMMGSGSGGSQQSTTMRRGNCMQQLGCELDMA
uniref:Uncharacterized protein n=1 Tax=Plectus sambesii TaxID=2011161 RepID=A0A914UIU7_9BILA